MACARLGDVYANAYGNKVAARPWFIRAIRLVEHEPPCLEQGYAAVAAMGCDVDDPAVLVERADLALDRARRFGDVDLETKALADGGLAYVQAGRVTAGMAMMDEAMALACGGSTRDAEVVAKALCSFFTVCYFTADFERVEVWSRVFRQRGLLRAAPGPQAFLRSHCDSVQGTLLCHLGRWSEAEDLLTRALAEIEEVMPGSAWHPRSPWPSCASSRVAWPRRRPCSSVGTITSWPCSRPPGCTWPGATSTWPEPRPVAGCGCWVTTGFGLRLCSGCSFRPNSIGRRRSGRGVSRARRSHRRPGFACPGCARGSTQGAGAPCRGGPGGRGGCATGGARHVGSGRTAPAHCLAAPRSGPVA